MSIIVVIDYEFIQLHRQPHGVLFIVAILLVWRFGTRSAAAAVAPLDQESIERHRELVGDLQFVLAIFVRDHCRSLSFSFASVAAAVVVIAVDPDADERVIGLVVIHGVHANVSSAGRPQEIHRLLHHPRDGRHRSRSPLLRGIAIDTIIVIIASFFSWRFDVQLMKAVVILHGGQRASPSSTTMAARSSPLVQPSAASEPILPTPRSSVGGGACVVSVSPPFGAFVLGAAGGPTTSDGAASSSVRKKPPSVASSSVRKNEFCESSAHSTGVPSSRGVLPPSPLPFIDVVVAFLPAEAGGNLGDMGGLLRPRGDADARGEGWQTLVRRRRCCSVGASSN
mmetsp:Transcript_19593/g.47003  ORF Transcript_19593/g.47003 Transcript_19593/m.47003 type:complete len:339 (+) Transcript_19593:1331-2347(+)